MRDNIYIIGYVEVVEKIVRSNIVRTMKLNRNTVENMCIKARQKELSTFCKVSLFTISIFIIIIHLDRLFVVFYDQLAGGQSTQFVLGVEIELSSSHDECIVRNKKVFNQIILKSS